MRIFVLTTGRTASTTFANACRHIVGMSAAHESQATLIKNRLVYPDNHVEVDNRLAWFLGTLDRLYDDSTTYYVHLRRDRNSVGSSYAKRWYVRQSLVRGFYQSVLMRKAEPSAIERLDACMLCVDTIEDNIEFFLKGRNNWSAVTVENFCEDFTRFVDDAGVECDIDSALAELRLTTNVNKGSGDTKGALRRSTTRLSRAIRGLPEYWRSL